MWTSNSEKLCNERGLRFTLELDTRPATFADVVRGWQEDVNFQKFFNSLLAESPFLAFRLETPAVSVRTLSKSFEFVLMDSPELSRSPDRNAFAEHFTTSESVAVFPNLRGDATMIVPCPVTDVSAYGHLADFVRHAPEFQRHALWKCVGDAMNHRVGDKPIWLSTAGAGVAWLHVRLDDRPKYYNYRKYAQFKTSIDHQQESGDGP